MTRVASVDGVVLPPERAVVSVYDRGFLYGDGVFETLRAYGGRPFALADHLARLARSAAAVGIRLPVPAPTLEREVRAALVASGEKDASVRLIVTRGAATPPALVPREDAPATRVILVEPLAVDRAAYAAGLRVVTLAWARALDPARAAQAKLLPYLTSLLALKEARARGAEDAVFVDGGLVREAATSNVFVVRQDGSLVTPPDGPGVLAGITRAQVLDLALAMGLTCSVSSLATRELAAAQEVFLTSSLRELAPVVAVDGAPIGAGAPGPTTRLLHRALRLRAGAEGACPWE